jgi:hypothetical protein
MADHKEEMLGTKMFALQQAHGMARMAPATASELVADAETFMKFLEIPKPSSIVKVGGLN